MTESTRYASVLAKIGVERSRLLSEAKLKSLTESKNLNDIVTQLRGTSYAEKLTKLPSSLTSNKLERVFQENLIEIYIKIIRYSPRSVQSFLSLYILRYEIENIKTLIKATYAKLDTTQKLARIYFSVEDFLKRRSVIEETAKAPNLKQTVDSLKNTEYELSLSLGFKSFEEGGSTTCFDVLLDKMFYEKLYSGYQDLPKRDKPHAYFFVSMESDSFTLLTLLRGKNLNYDSNWLQLAVPMDNFSISKQMVENFASAPNFESALNLARKGEYAQFFTKAPTPEDTIATGERNFRKAMFEYAKHSIVSEIFNVGMILVFMIQKAAEVYNLTAISIGVEAGLKPEEIRNQLLL